MEKPLRNINAVKAVTVVGLDGTKSTVSVRTLRIKHFPDLLVAQLDMPVQAEIYAGKERGWADKIADESILEVIDRGEELNSDFFVLWLQRIRAAKTKLLPDAPSISKDGSQTAPPSADSPGDR